MPRIEIVLLGQPVAFGWANHMANGAQIIPKAKRNMAAALRLKAQEVLTDRGFTEPLNIPVRMDVFAEFQIPQSWSKTKRHLASLGGIEHATRPDWDNLAKLIGDALKGVVYRDDCLINEAHIYKRYSAQPKLKIVIT